VKARFGHAEGRSIKLPAENELVGQLRRASYASVKTINLVPGERFMAFQAFRGYRALCAHSHRDGRVSYRG
jgi:hypothetical protein